MLNYRVNPIQIDLPKPASRPQSCPRKVWMVLGPATNWLRPRARVEFPMGNSMGNIEKLEIFSTIFEDFPIFHWTILTLEIQNFLGFFLHNSVMKVDCLLSYYLYSYMKLDYNYELSMKFIEIH